MPELLSPDDFRSSVVVPRRFKDMSPEGNPYGSELNQLSQETP
jgi:hypothetical protein